MNKTIQFFGPFFTNFSYARITRGLAFGINNLKTEYQAFVSGNPETLDYNPNSQDLKTQPEIEKIYKPFGFESDVVIYNNYPKTITNLNGLDKLPGKLKLQFLSWEESIYPKAWVEEVNKNLHGVMAISSFVKEILINSGVNVPIQVVSLGVNHAFLNAHKNKYPLKTKKNIKFYHNSTGKKRKGVDLLIKAFLQSFTAKDDVCLVIKTTPQVENQFTEIIEKFKKEDSPEIELIISDLSDEQMAALQYTVDASVYPSRAEGFGIPALESMLLEKPVIVTNYGGFVDFCNSQNSYLLDYKITNTDATELVNPGAKWAEPDFDSLKKILQQVFYAIKDIKSGVDSSDAKLLKDKVKNAKETANQMTWERFARDAIDFIKTLENISNLKTKNIGVLSFLNDETGIADYTQDLYMPVEGSFRNVYYLSNKDISDRRNPDKINVLRCWTTGETSFDELVNTIKEKQIEIVHVQYHSGSMFPIESLDLLVNKLLEAKIKPVLTMHAVRGPSFDFVKSAKNLNKWHKIFIHNLADFEYASKSLNNLVHFTHPNLLPKKRDKNKLKKELGLDKYQYVIGTHGLLNKHKNISQIIKAVSNLKKDYQSILFLSLSAVSSNNILAQGVYKECIDLIESESLVESVIFFKDFLEDSQIQMLMQVMDVAVFAYDDVGESASGAVRKSLTCGAVTIVSDIPMFKEFSNEVIKIPSNNYESIESSIRLALEDSNLRLKVLQSANDYVLKNSYEKKSLEMLASY